MTGVLAVALASAAASILAWRAEPLTAPPRPSFTPVVFAKLRAGIAFSEGVENGASAGSVRGVVIIKAAPAAAFAMLTDHSNFFEFMPRVVSTKVSGRTQRGERSFQVIDAAVTKVSYSLDYRWDPQALRIEFRLAKDVPHEIKEAAGSWQLWELDGGKATLLEYRTSADVGRAVPGFIKSHLQERGVKDAVDAVRKRVESGGAWKK